MLLYHWICHNHAFSDKLRSPGTITSLNAQRHQPLAQHYMTNIYLPLPFQQIIWCHSARRWTNARWMLVHRPRRWANINPALDQRNVSVGSADTALLWFYWWSSGKRHWANGDVMLGHHLRCSIWVNVYRKLATGAPRMSHLSNMADFDPVLTAQIWLSAGMRGMVHYDTSLKRRRLFGPVLYRI